MPLIERRHEAQILDRANKLSNGGIRALHRQYGKARKAVGKASDGACQMIIHLAGDRDPLRGNRSKVLSLADLHELPPSDEGAVMLS